MFGTTYPIIQAPMAGGTTTPALVAAVSNAGALGSLGAAYMTPAQIRDTVAEIRRLTDRPFAVNLFAGGHDSPHDVDPTAMLAILARHHEALGLQRPTMPAWPADRFPEQFEAVLEARPAIFSFTFGLPAEAIRRARDAGIRTVGTATTVDEAQRLEAAGIDAVVAQGSEAGGHRGTFAGPFENAMIGTMALVPQVVDAVSVPVIASGGIMDGRGIVAARALGAAAVQMGTAFLGCDEAGVAEAHRTALEAGHEDAATVTRAFSGRPARGLVNDFMRDVHAAEKAGPVTLPFAVHGALTGPMRRQASRVGDIERMSLWSGQGVRMFRRMPAAELVRRLVEESATVAAGLG
ncbi:NAD(P)H-dependent flavin oxidoreductase [Limobrevibacterium gyesilva]|uniref:Nitronate monooxygenase n=1 Tax=Limobrevibacterium gyesilva TaxID=2991712 RepID=A0AA41YMT0_9PROT|nr:nitronate monooxygenase [Limobrevibacterium gyesilva]MCW3473378.1 nitronate monooxygenase [Limobrevibacterium gyesilva]